VTVRYLDLADFVEIAAEVTGRDLATVVAVANLDLADSALHAPTAGFGDKDLYPDFVEKCGYSSFVSHGTIRCPTATNERSGCRCVCSLS
jgi:hypothetical protein